MHKSIKYLIPAVLALTLAACGGSSSKSGSANYSGKSGPADLSTVDSAQKEKFGTDSAKVVYEAISFSDADGIINELPFGVETQSNDSSTHELVKRITKESLAKVKQAKEQDSSFSQLPSAFKIEGKCSLGGTQTIQVEGNEAGTKKTFIMASKNCKEDEDYLDSDSYDFTNGKVLMVMTEGNLRIEFSNYEEQEVVKGKVVSSSKVNGYYQVSGLFSTSNVDNDVDFDEEDFDAVYFDLYNMDYTAEWKLNGHLDGKAFATNGTMTCKDFKCSVGTTVKTDDGKTYKVENLEITTKSNGNPSAAKGTIYHPEYGSYSFTATIDAMCDEDDKSPFIGTATFTDETTAVTYTSGSCTSDPIID